MKNRMERNLRSSRRSSVYRTSPRQSRIRRKYRIPETDDELSEALDELLRQTWTIFCVSALFGFKRDESYLKKYAKRLREEVALHLSQENVAYNAKFLIADGVAPTTSPVNQLPIKIEVYSATIDQDESVEKCIYKGILLSWNLEQNEDAIESTKLPLLLCRGARGATDIVHTALRKMFDCMIMAMPATVEDLMWLIPIVITDTEPASLDEIKAEYTVPGLPVSETITVRFNVKDLINILTVSIKGDKQKEDLVHLKHIQRFHECLHTQMLEMSGIQLGLCTLRRINLPSIILVENRMKVTGAETMNRVLVYLNEKALDMCYNLSLDV